MLICILNIVKLDTVPTQDPHVCIWKVSGHEEKLFHLGRLHMHPIEWQLKDHWTHTKHLDPAIPVTTNLCQALK